MGDIGEMWVRYRGGDEHLRRQQDGAGVGGDHGLPHRVEAEHGEQDDPAERVGEDQPDTDLLGE